MSMQIIYGHPNSGGPTRFIQYSRDEVLNHLVLAANAAAEQQKSIVAATEFRINVVVDGILAATVFAAVLLRVANVPLANTCYDKDTRVLTVGYADKNHKQTFISCVDTLFAHKAVLDLKQDPWGNNLCTHDIKASLCFLSS